MCGRYSLIAAIGDLEGLFDFVFGDTDYTPSYNIAPTQHILTVVGAPLADFGAVLRPVRTPGPAYQRPDAATGQDRNERPVQRAPYAVALGAP